MNEEVDKPEEELSAEPEAEPQEPRGGERLAEARRERQISVLEAFYIFPPGAEESHCLFEVKN